VRSRTRSVKSQVVYHVVLGSDKGSWWLGQGCGKRSEAPDWLFDFCSSLGVSVFAFWKQYLKTFVEESHWLVVVSWFRITYTRKAYRAFQKLPQNALLFLNGAVFCFFGGSFPTLFAAIQAAEYGGRMAVVVAISDLSDEAMIIIEESKKDDAKDEDKDGKKDVEQISSAEYMTRKTKLVLRKMNPEKIDKAIASLYRVWLAVAAVLTIQFARTISMSLAIADFLKKPCK